MDRAQNDFQHGLDKGLDLHEFWIPGTDCDLGYRNIRDLDNDTCTEIRRLLEVYWDQCKDFMDEKFREEFARQPDARFWEIYLCRRLLNAGHPLVKRKERPAKGPDFFIDDGDRRVWIEAVTFGHGHVENPDRVPEMEFRSVEDDGPLVAQPVPVNEVELRISSVFDKKSNKFKEYAINGLVGINDVNLIAINPGKVSMHAGYEGRGSPMCVLYPLGDQYVTFFKDTDKTASGYHLRTEIKKALGREVPIGVFADEQHNYVSAVIWSKTTLGNFFTTITT